MGREGENFLGRGNNSLCKGTETEENLLGLRTSRARAAERKQRRALGKQAEGQVCTRTEWATKVRTVFPSLVSSAAYKKSRRTWCSHWGKADLEGKTDSSQVRRQMCPTQSGLTPEVSFLWCVNLYKRVTNVAELVYS